MKMWRATLALVLLSCVQSVAQEPPLPHLDEITHGQPLVSTRETQVDFTSKVTGRRYRLMIAAPYQSDASKTYPIVYIIDGYWYFRPAVDFATESGDRFQPAIMVGIGYPTDDYKEECDRRLTDLSIPPVPPAKPFGNAPAGDGDAFLRMIRDEVKPFVEKRYRVDTSHQTLYGKSLGGLMTLRQLFRDPAQFQTYIAASPSIARSSFAVLSDEAAFSRRAAAGQLHLKLLITSADLEQPRDEPATKWNRPVDNASDLAARLKVLDPKDVQVDYVDFADETHFSVSLACLGRGLAFALSSPPEARAK
jgi:predicted alpha/beta superfamily hydrolase